MHILTVEKSILMFNKKTSECEISVTYSRFNFKIRRSRDMLPICLHDRIQLLASLCNLWKYVF